MTTYWNFVQLNVSPINSNCNVSTIPNLSFTKVQLFGNINKNSWQSIHDLSHKFYNIYILDEMIFFHTIKTTCFTIERVQIHNNFFDTNSKVPKNANIFFCKLLACDKFNNFYNYLMQEKLSIIFPFLCLCISTNVVYFNFKAWFTFFLNEAKKALHLHKSKQASMEQYLCCGQRSLLDLEMSCKSTFWLQHY